MTPEQVCEMVNRFGPRVAKEELHIVVRPDNLHLFEQSFVDLAESCG